MIPFAKTFAAILLLFATLVSLPAQQINFQALNGPFGLSQNATAAANGSGRLFLFTNQTVYSSSDNGNTWGNSNAGLPGNMYSLNFVRSNNGEMYLSIENASAIYKYLPATNAWKTIPVNIGTWGTYDGFDIDPQGRFWFSADASFSTLYYSDNEGQTLVQLPVNGQIAGWFDRLTTFNDDHNLIAVSYGTNQKVYHFNKAGVIQQVMSSTPLNFLSYNPHTGTAYYGDFQSFKRSVNGGLNWTNVIVDVNISSPYASDIIFDAVGNIWIQTGSGVYKSADDGLTWIKDNNLSQSFGKLYVCPNNNWLNINSCSFPNFGLSTDTGQNWTDLSTNFSKPFVSDIKKDAAGTLYAQTCRRGYFEKSTDDGQTWSDLIIQDSIANYVKSMVTRPDGMILASCTNLKLYRSFNNGQDWEKVALPTPQIGSPILGNLDIDYYGALYLSMNFSLHKSTDNGDSWQLTKIPSWSFYDVEFHPNGDVYVSDGSVFSVVQAGTDTIFSIQLNGEPIYDVGLAHCTSNGITYFFSNSPFSNFSMYRIMPDGNYQPEPIPFFDDLYGISAITSNAEGDVFVVYHQLIYKSEDQGASWQNVGNIPAGGNLHNIYITDDQYMYAGFSGNVIHKSTAPTAERNLVSGQVWLDNDGNCQYDAGESYQTGIGVVASGNGNYVGFSGLNGNYALSAPSGTYSMKVQVPNALYEPCLPSPPMITLNGPNDAVTVNMPIKVVAQCPYLSIHLSTSLLRRCFQNTYTVKYKNEGTATATGAYVSVTLDPYFIFHSASIPFSAQNGQTYTFPVGDLAPGASGQFKIVVEVSCDATLGQLHCISATIFPNDLCLPTLPLLANDRECRENVGSFDPNDKRAYVNGMEEPGYVLPNTDIEYLIRFQNTGTDTAFRVVVEDRFSGLLDLASFTPLVSSHPYRVEVKGQQTLRFVFENVQLPDSNINEAASHGFLKFRIKQVQDAPLGSFIKNKADIFFDFNAPVATNETVLLVGTVGTKPEPKSAFMVSAYPNPFGPMLTFEVAGQALPDHMSLRLFDALGRQVRRQEFSGEKLSILRNGLDNGLYYFLIESDGNRIGSGLVEAR